MYRLSAAIGLATLITACGAGPQASGSFQTHSKYDRLFSAAMQAAPEVGYRITSVNRAEGLITAEANVAMGRGAAVGMTVMVYRGDDMRRLTVSFAAPPGTFSVGSFGESVDEYINAVRASVPDLQASR